MKIDLLLKILELNGGNTSQYKKVLEKKSNLSISQKKELREQIIKKKNMESKYKPYKETQIKLEAIKRLTLEGKSNKLIAQEMKVSEDYIKTLKKRYRLIHLKPYKLPINWAMYNFFNWGRIMKKR